MGGQPLSCQVFEAYSGFRICFGALVVIIIIVKFWG